MDANQAVFDRDAEVYIDRDLMAPERAVLSLLHERLHEFEMLDLGVGGGRTAYTFAALVRRYVGLDYSPRMIERARQLLGDDERVELVNGDARDLSTVSGPFDFVLFSFNGIDAVGHEDRLRILTEVRRTLKPDGHFLFSTHSLRALPLETSKPRSRYWRKSRLYSVYLRAASIPYRRRTERVNGEIDFDEARERGWTIVRDVSHGFQLRLYYVDPVRQIEQLREVGLETVAVYDMQGGEIAAADAGRDSSLHYLCRPLQATA
jgi:ubiquinone/menaquinone biosynthesis C-methylase UbiE